MTDTFKAEKCGNSLVYAGVGILLMIGQVYLMMHNLTEGKPYKVVDPLLVFYYTAYLGVPISVLLSALAVYFMRSRITNYLLPMIPVIAFPILLWGIYQSIFAWTGLDFFSGSGDFSVRLNEQAFASDVIATLFLGCIAGIIAAGICAAISRKSLTR